MKKIVADVLQFRGTHYEFGFKQGEKLNNTLLLTNREQQWQVRKPQFRMEVEESKEVFGRFAPLIWEELLGLRDALHWEMERILLEFGGYRVPLHPSGCSIYVGDHYMIRNYDYHPKTYDGRYVLYQPSDGGYSTIGVTQKVTGRSDGMNEKGLVMGYTFNNRKRPGKGFTCHIIGRLILELCRNTEEAVDMLKEIPHRGSFSWVLVDQSCERPYIIETSPRGVEVRQGRICTNHFQIMKEENRHILDDSKKRMDIIEELTKPSMSADAAFQLLNDTQKGIFSQLYGSWAGTIHTTAYFPNELKAWVALGGDQIPTEFNFLQWLDGGEVSIDRIQGEIDTDIPFVHMEKADWYRQK